MEGEVAEGAGVEGAEESVTVETAGELRDGLINGVDTSTDNQGDTERHRSEQLVRGGRGRCSSSG